MDNISSESVNNKNSALEEKLYSIKRTSLIENILFQLRIIKNIKECLIWLSKIKGEVVSTRVLRKEFIELMHPDWNRIVLQNRDGVFSSENGWKFILKRVFPGAIMTMDGSDHLYQRRIMSQAFKKPMLVSYLNYMNPNISEGLASWELGKSFSVYPNVKSLTLDLATRVFMGVEPNQKSVKINKAFVDTVEASIALIRIPIPPFNMWKGVRGRKYLVKEFYSLLPQKRRENTPDFFSQFCHAKSEEGETFSDQEIVDHMIFLMMAAHDTTTSALTTLFYVLAKHPEWQDRLRKKSQSIGREHLDFDDLAELVEIEWAMKECLRIYPPLPMMLRRTVKDAEYMGVKFNKGSYLAISPIHSHFMEEYWDEPEQFDPERWSPERAEYKRHAYQWIPFGGGAHMCVGQHFADLQVKAVLHQILLKFEWSVPDGYEVPYQLIPIAKPEDGLPITIKRIG